MTRAWEAREWVEGTTRTGAAGLEVDPRGRLGPRTCPECRTRLDDVDGLGEHPWCDRSAGVRRTLAALVRERRRARLRGAA